MIFKALLINTKKTSKKGYKYSKEVVIDALDDSALQARLEAGSLWCEITTSDKNPKNKKFSVYDADANHLCGTIKKLYWEKDKLYGDIEPFRTGYGKELSDAISSNNKIRILLKGRIEVNSNNYVTYLHIATFTWLKENI